MREIRKVQLHGIFHSIEILDGADCLLSQSTFSQSWYRLLIDPVLFGVGHVLSARHLSQRAFALRKPEVVYLDRAESKAQNFGPYDGNNGPSSEFPINCENAGAD